MSSSPGSAGTAVAAALRVAARGVDAPVVVLLPDSWDRYLSTAWLQELRESTSRSE